mmetsp:Transcript_2295/g.4234  ORF Transcript_2295/g.4234 Transcript_2295/m.4234 type:complete len:332 (+) Transcript_2295:124-1119(+)
MPSEKDEGICPLALVRFLAERHNAFVERVDERLLMRGEDIQRHTQQHDVVSSKFLVSAHAISYDMYGGVIPFIEKQCVQYSSRGAVAYDFDNAERYLLDLYFSGKPIVELEVPMIQYSDEAGASVMSLLKQKVRQQALPSDMSESILKELNSPSQAQKCMELLETCISFLQATGGTYIQRLEVGEKTLGEYVSTVLMLNQAEFQSKVVVQQVCLKHIDSLYKLLKSLTTVDLFANVRPKYRETLDQKMAQELGEIALSLDTRSLCPLLQDFVTEQLKEDHISADESIKTIIGYLELNDTYLTDFPWFQQFPEHIPMRFMMDVYSVLASVGA